MARRRTIAQKLPKLFPVPLANREDPFWENLDEVTALYRDIGQQPPQKLGSKPFQTAPGWARFAAFRALFCELAGLMHPKYTGNIDIQRASALGIDMRSLARLRLSDPSVARLDTSEQNTPTGDLAQDTAPPKWDGQVPFASYPLGIWQQYAHSLKVTTNGNKAAIIQAIAKHYRISTKHKNPAETVELIRAFT